MIPTLVNYILDFFLLHNIELVHFIILLIMLMFTNVEYSVLFYSLVVAQRQRVG